jgi:hypothetical protein
MQRVRLTDSFAEESRSYHPIRQGSAGVHGGSEASRRAAGKSIPGGVQGRNCLFLTSHPRRAGKRAGKAVFQSSSCLFCGCGGFWRGFRGEKPACILKKQACPGEIQARLAGKQACWAAAQACFWPEHYRLAAAQACPGREQACLVSGRRCGETPQGCFFLPQRRPVFMQSRLFPRQRCPALAHSRFFLPPYRLAVQRARLVLPQRRNFFRQDEGRAMEASRSASVLAGFANTPVESRRGRRRS